jgi:nicotinate-nucleotide--dimethylbenzimidazole phosphoribosyltransferase
MSNSTNFLDIYSEFDILLQTVQDIDELAVEAVRKHDAQLTKPAGSLGQIEMLVRHLAGWQGKEKPTLNNPMVAIFAGNHGVTAQGISPFPAEVTVQMVANFTAGGAAISQICAMHELNLRVFELALEIPTKDFTLEPALSDKDCAATIAYGMEAIAGNPDLLCIGEMGIGNTTVASALYAALFGGSGIDWVGRGAGIDDEGLKRKIDVVDKGLALHANEGTHPLEILARLGGREIAAMVGAIVAARHKNIPVIIDGFVATSAAAVVYACNPEALDHCIFAHVSEEVAHKRALEKMSKTALLNLGMRLGEGSGAALAAVLAKTALHLHNNMATFEQAAVSNKSE